MSRGGARVWGNAHPAAQLTDKKVIRYRGLVRTGKATVGEIAAREGCSHGRISMAMRGETWAHLNDVAPPIPGRPRGPSVTVATGRKVAATKSGAKKAAGTKVAAKPSAAKKSAAKAVAKKGGAKTVAKKAVAKKTSAKKAVATKRGATRGVAKTAAAKKPVAKKATVRKTGAKTARR